MELIIYTLRSISSAIVEPPLMFILAVLTILFYFKNKKTESMQKIIIGGKGESALELTLSQFVFGIIGGTVGSLILSGLGVKFSYESGIQYLFFISIILMFFKPKYICFSYSAGILGTAVILVEMLSGVFPEMLDRNTFKIDIVYLLLFVGVFHVVEGILVMLDGHRGGIPVFTESENKIIGGYAFKRYWIIPISMIFMTEALRINNSIDMSVNIPYWWPLVNGTGLTLSGIIVMMPFYAIIGYSSVTFTKNKRKKSFISGLNILTYGICVIIISQVAQFGIIGRIFAVIFLPVAHEFMLKIQNKSEEKNELIFVSDDEGLVVLDISRDSQMLQYGLEIGDKVLSVNGNSIISEREIYEILKKNLYRVNMMIRKKNGEIKEFIHVHDKTKRLGILLVPRKVIKGKVTEVKDSSFKNILEEIKRVKDSPKNS